MDDFIRKAADDYPLKISNSDWDKVFVGLQSPAAVQLIKSRKYWWLLLLLLPLIIAVPVLHQPNLQSSAIQAGSFNNNTATTKQGASSLLHHNNPVGEKKVTGSASVTTPKQGKMDKQFLKVQPGNTAKSQTSPAMYGRNNDARSGINKKPNDISVGKTNEAYVNNNEDVLTNTSDSVADIIKSSTLQPGYRATEEVKTDIAIDTAAKQDQHNTENDITVAITTGNNNTDKESLAALKDSTAISKSAKKKHTAPVKTKGVYVGVAAGLDATSVKFDKIKKTGYSTALLIGYRINNNWSVESGWMWDNKKYYSNGEYFDKSRTGIPNSSFIHFLNGTCRMYEVPLNVKYDFKSKRLSGFYVLTGISSYFMKKENYEYHATNSGNYYVGHRVYKNSTNNLFSVVNISGGYQVVFKHQNSLRIEPYFKIPLHGLGIGKLPFESTGLSAAYTLPLH